METSNAEASLGHDGYKSAYALTMDDDYYKGERKE